MSIYEERRFVPYQVEQMYRLVSDVERYPDFLPWCLGTRIRERTEYRLLADLIVGYRVFRESFTSQVDLTPFRRIDVTYIKGPFRNLKTYWIFESEDDGCWIDFRVEFTFESSFLESVTKVVFHKIVHRMVRAFEERAHQLYGKTTNSSATSNTSNAYRVPKPN